MRLLFGRRAMRWQRGMPHFDIAGVAELGLLALLAILCARLVYAVVTPVGPLGDWRAPAPASDASPAVLGAFDPFSRLASANGPAVVTGANLTLFGVRSDQATGRGAAIIGLPDGSQQSFAVGEEIIPGVTLKAVAFDGVTVTRGGRDEQLFLDQSRPATVVKAAP
ncbi:MAG TPA: type II secretion system protein N [Sphingomonadaceae bacterium]|nr:type II secretion system protein N [Sphingomonadaceae bacterium]